MAVIFQAAEIKFKCYLLNDSEHLYKKRKQILFLKCTFLLCYFEKYLELALPIYIKQILIILWFGLGI